MASALGVLQELRICPVCKSTFAPRTSHQKYCSDRCGGITRRKNYRESHKEEIAASSKPYRRLHKKERAAYLREWRAAHPDVSAKHNETRRRAALEILGGKCARCGYCADWRALQIDHVAGGGTKQHKEMPHKSMYDVLAGVNLDQYQCLCANCNWIKRYENKEHKGINKRLGR